MDSRQIHYFTEVVKQGSFSKAADHLFVSQPTISNVVKDLEKELDTQLLIRTTRKLELTDTGKLLYQYGEQFSQLFRQLNQELNDVKDAAKGTIKMGIFSSVGTEILTDIMSDFYKRYPNILIRFVEDGESNLKNALDNGELDLIVLEESKNKNLNYIPFLKGDLRLLVHETHPFADKESVSWKELMDEKFIIFHEGFAVRRFIMKECERMGFQPNIICETSQWKFIFEMVSSNMGISILPQSDVTELKVSHLGIKVLPLIDQEVHWQIGIVWQKDGYTSYATRAWIQFLKQRLE
ncbi:LysR family transcriptional regulator [Sporosarcina thermotolerans]|uniref:LysR family transcriptional regulator n=1 Tax=Sporosarcina thermotolerans TaxID=633404 RepID=A0AAW9A616_9BACL|nr:LysR family transcriptional regulator [Sporosarcina thermotolerans]MDW0116345.1 LysR family transcriptional regulator [Sporosarcina thermotolerans]WHT48308.1 LysR family transcriptional regulator [Sporosarcina thermotolerans]